MRSTRQLVAYGLIALGAVTILARLGPATGWLWVALAATAFLVAYSRERTYPFLVVGGVLGGISSGLLLEGGWGWPGAFLVCLGAGFLLIDRVEPRPSRWPIYPAAILIGVGLVYWLYRVGFIESLWFPLLLIAAGIVLLRRSPSREWVRTERPDRSEREGEGPAPVGGEETVREGGIGP